MINEADPQGDGKIVYEGKSFPIQKGRIHVCVCEAIASLSRRGSADSPGNECSRCYFLNTSVFQFTINILSFPLTSLSIEFVKLLTLQK